MGLSPESVGPKGAAAKVRMAQGHGFAWEGSQDATHLLGLSSLLTGCRWGLRETCLRRGRALWAEVLAARGSKYH